ncbi:peroxiredoxin [Swaminathania salitolerans]|uniref:thioredoxin-dependent peroxiredoxin n=1 Tax=Swaminathania salitolerans TaxID=182838 RepID=A0A511BMI9_9PROT|nr:peroxiredoxin [Swaminathania salitolerans]GBQ09882.1 thioredoxin peroxidase [Swaminathania salitolerans LMG 21291]GEL01083.1 peroxiredoxin [Swaminathania salitolerans]
MTPIRLPALVAIAVLGLSPAYAALKEGAKAPDFSLPAAQDGRDTGFSLYEALSKGPVVLYFYPAAFTKGCTMEAHGFARALPEFSALGASVIGVSMDSLSKLEAFSKDEIGGKFIVASDAQGKVTRLYDAKMPMLDIARRVTYVIAPQGRIIDTIASDTPGNHVDRALAALRTWKKDQMKR